MGQMLAIWESISWSNVASIVFGAAISALVSYFLQRNSFAEARRSREKEKNERREAIGGALLFKMIRLTSDLEHLGKGVRQMLLAANEKKFLGAPFQIVVPVAPLPDKVTFSPDEMSLILSMDTHLFNQMAALDELHNSTVALFEMYGNKRNSIMERFGAKMEGAVGTTGLTEQDKLWLEPRAFELNQLVDFMLQRAEGDGKQAWEALESLHAVLQKEFGIKYKLELKIV
jgi:hypothetical protein